MDRNKRRKIIVGMSGGVDSSVAAALLAAEGHEVVGAFMKNWSDTKDPVTGACAWKEERRDALRVAAHLGIPFVTFDFENEYREAVVNYMIREYAAGRTPNPDVMCNKSIKFDCFLREALALGADAIATGHYARVSRDDAGFKLLAGCDPGKDQSYFLHQLTQAQLGRTLFPVGHLPKTEVRRLARQFGLPTAEKKDSQGICFIGKVDLKEFLSKSIPQRPGPVVTREGREVGRHDGVMSYTIGQRHGFGGGGGAAYFVVAKDVAANTLVVAPDTDETALLSAAFRLENPHWIADKPAEDETISVRVRYRQPLQNASIRGDIVRFAEPQRAVTEGQFAVFYEGERCLGGGVIAAALAVEDGAAAQALATSGNLLHTRPTDHTVEEP